MNADTDWEKIPDNLLSGVVMEIITRILGLRAKFGHRSAFCTRQIGVKSAFRQIGVVPGRATAFVDRLRYLTFVELRFSQFVPYAHATGERLY